MNKSKYISLFLFIVFFQSQAQAQDADTALFRQLKIVKITSWVKLPMMLKQRDTCLSETRTLNDLGKVTYIKTDYNCMGWNRMDETIFTYDKNQNPAEIKYLSNNQIVSHTFFKYNEKGYSIYEKRVYFEPADTFIMYYDPQYDKKGVLLSERVTSNKLEQPPYLRKSTYKDGLISQVDIVNDTGEVLAKYNYYYNKDKQLVDETFESFKPSYNYSKELLDYQDGKLFRKTNTADNTATEFIYYSNGLIYKTMWYNRFGGLERLYYNYYETKKEWN